MNVEVFLGFVVNKDLELGDSVLRFGDYYEIVGRQNFQLFSFVIVLVILSNNGRMDKKWGSEPQ